jgi:hypothetical protein
MVDVVSQNQLITVCAATSLPVPSNIISLIPSNNSLYINSQCPRICGNRVLLLILLLWSYVWWACVYRATRKIFMSYQSWLRNWKEPKPDILGVYLIQIYWPARRSLKRRATRHRPLRNARQCIFSSAMQRPKQPSALIILILCSR